MPKKVTFGGKPPTTIDEFVNQGKELDQKPVEAEKMKRLTIDIPETLHRAIKSRAANEGIPMADMLRELLQEHYGKS